MIFKLIFNLIKAYWHSFLFDYHFGKSKKYKKRKMLHAAQYKLDFAEYHLSKLGEYLDESRKDV